MNTNPYIQASTDTATTSQIQKQEAVQQLTENIGNARDVLFRATTIFPFTLFPDTLTIDRAKLTITRRAFLNAGEVLSISIEDLLNVTAAVGPIFGSIKISTRFFDPNKPYQIDFFWRKDALKIKRIAQGYIIAQQKGIDCSALSSHELARTLDELGKVASGDKV
jgi:hypothetical protein